MRATTPTGPSSSETTFKGKKVEVSRFKGLGEMNPQQLKETTMDPKTRGMIRITLPQDWRGAPAVRDLVDRLMGRNPEHRFHFIQSRAAQVHEEAIDAGPGPAGQGPGGAAAAPPPRGWGLERPPGAGGRRARRPPPRRGRRRAALWAARGAWPVGGRRGGALCGASILWITAIDMRARGTSGRMRPIRGFDGAIGLGLLLPSLYALSLVWADLGLKIRGPGASADAFPGFGERGLDHPLPDRKVADRGHRRVGLAQRAEDRESVAAIVAPDRIDPFAGGGVLAVGVDADHACGDDPRDALDRAHMRNRHAASPHAFACVTVESPAGFAARRTPVSGASLASRPLHPPVAPRTRISRSQRKSSTTRTRGVWRSRSWVSNQSSNWVVGLGRQAPDKIGIEIGDQGRQHGQAEPGARRGEQAGRGAVLHRHCIGEWFSFEPVAIHHPDHRAAPADEGMAFSSRRRRGRPWASAYSRLQ